VTIRGGQAKVKAKWDDSKTKIVIETTSANGTQKQEYSIEGDWLVITNTGPPRGGGDAVTTKLYYRKAS
jgi:hypothetical protein